MFCMCVCNLIHTPFSQEQREYPCVHAKRFWLALLQAETHKLLVLRWQIEIICENTRDICPQNRSHCTRLKQIYSCMAWVQEHGYILCYIQATCDSMGKHSGVFIQVYNFLLSIFTWSRFWTRNAQDHKRCYHLRPYLWMLQTVRVWEEIQGSLTYSSDEIIINQLSMTPGKHTAILIPRGRNVVGANELVSLWHTTTVIQISIWANVQAGSWGLVKL